MSALTAVTPARPQRSDVAASYDRGVEAYEVLWSPVILPPAVAVVAALGLSSRCVVVDVGAGTGALHPVIRAAAPGARVVAVDASIEMLNSARRRGLCSAVHADALALPLADDIADAVLLAYVLFHLADPARGLREARRVLRAGGRVGAITWGWERPTRAHIVWDEILADAAVPPIRPRKADAGLDRPGALGDLLRSAGLRPQRIWPQQLRRQWDASSFWQLATGSGVSRSRLDLVDAQTRSAVLTRLRDRLAELQPDDFLWQGEVLCVVAAQDG